MKFEAECLLISDLIVQLMGCGVLAVAVWLWSTRGESVSIIPTHTFLSASSLCVISSIIILIIGFMGCCGAFIENQCLLIGVSDVLSTYH